MRVSSGWKSLALWLACAGLLCGQGLTTTATKDDWEEINFEFNSSVLSDGYPSLLRLAELLHQNPEYKVTLDGNTDSVGSNRYNDKLAASRAATVKSFLVKYGATEGQISVVAHGKRQPKANNSSKEGRFINRRVTMTARDGQGRIVSAGGVGDAIKAMQATEASLAAQKKCCEDVLKRLDKLDEILAAIKDLKAENDQLKQDVAALKQGQAGVEKQVAELPRPPERGELQRMMESTATNAIEKAKPSRFSLLGVNVGPSLADSTIPGQVGRFGAVSVTFTGKGRYFAPFGRDETHALQADAEFMYYRDRQEGQFDVGLVNRWSRVQAGLFSSFKHVNVTDIGGGTLGQASFNADVLFSRGRFGFFGTKGFLDNRVLGRTPFVTSDGIVSYNVWNEYYLKIVDQVGASAQIGLWNDAYAEGNFGALFRSSGNNRPGGTVRLVQPFSSRIAATLEASLNETMVGSKNSGRVAFGLQFGNWVRPKDFMTVKHPVPVDVPRVRYEVLTRQVRTGHTPPVADAGPDQVGVTAGTITLDGSASYSPDGLPLTYEWSVLAGPSVQISNADAAKATFTAEAGQTYQFRLLVKDSLGGQAAAKTTVTTKAAATLRIARFTATPASINSGGVSTLAWDVEGADTVEINSIGRVNPVSGTAQVAPTETTTYTLTARNASGAVNATAVVTVNGGGTGGVKILSFQANPASITAGQSSTLSWQTENADSVTISGIGNVAQSGTTPVSPTQTATYTLTATGNGGQASSSVTVTVTGGHAVITSFTANPATINAGESSTLTWSTQNATSVTITGFGPVAPSGSMQVSPDATRTYTLTAFGQPGEIVKQDATVTVNSTQPSTPPTAVIAGPSYIISKQLSVYLDASPSTNPGGGALTYQWSGPPGITISNPTSTVTMVTAPYYGNFTLTVTVKNAAGQTSTANVTVGFVPPSDVEQ